MSMPLMLLRHQPTRALFQRCLMHPSWICRIARNVTLARGPHSPCQSFTGSGVGYRHPKYDASSPEESIPQANAPKRPQLSNFCRKCGGQIAMKVPPGENEERCVCSDCGYVDYYNPKLVVGCIVEHEGRLLLCRRAIEPCKGQWTVPAGFLEMGESSAAGAARETWEEANARVEIMAPYAHWDIPVIGQAYILFRARLAEPYTFEPGTESLETCLFAPHEIPFDKIAFSSVATALRFYVSDLKTGLFHIHHGVIEKAKGSAPNNPSTFELKDHFAVPITTNSEAAMEQEQKEIREVEPVTVGAVSAHVEQSLDHEQHKPFLEPVRGITNTTFAEQWIANNLDVDDRAVTRLSGKHGIYDLYKAECGEARRAALSKVALSRKIEEFVKTRHSVFAKPYGSKGAVLEGVRLSNEARLKEEARVRLEEEARLHETNEGPGLSGEGSSKEASQEEEGMSRVREAEDA